MKENTSPNKLPAATTLEELHGQVKFVTAIARVPQEDLESNIERIISNMDRIAQSGAYAPNAAGLRDTIRTAYALAKRNHSEFITGRAEYILELKQIAVWAGMIQLGWA